MKNLNEVAENYFNTLNPIAERISTDILAIQDAYEGLWNCLSIKEKNQIINETVVHPEAILKYTLNTKSCEGANLDIPLLTRQVTGSKYIVDEGTGLSWRDEHSAPFSWKTPSQINLSIFSSQDDIEGNINSYFVSNKNTVNENLNSTKLDKDFGIKSEIKSVIGKKSENGKKHSVSIQSQNVVLVGTCSKLSGLCSKLKFLPGKSYSYEVQTVVTNPVSSNDGSFLDKIKATAVLKLQNTLKLVGGKNYADKKTDEKESENLVQSKGAPTVIKLQKPSPKIAKPKSPPPPPPAVKQQKTEGEESKLEKNFIYAKNTKNEKLNYDERNSEKATLLEENSVQSFLSADPDSLEQDPQAKVAHELSLDLNSISTECTPLSGPSTEVIPKSGFDFLDNW